MFKSEKVQLSSVEREFQRIDISSDLGIQQLDLRVKETHELFWFNDKHTPQEFCDFIGTEARRLFEEHYAAQVFLSTRIKDYQFLTVPDSYNQPILHEDGTVTITKKSDVPIEEPVITE